MSPTNRDLRSAAVGLLLAALLLAPLVGCSPSPKDAAAPGEGGVDPTLDSDPPAPAVETLPEFDDYPAEEPFEGTPAAVDLDSHPKAKDFRTALTRDAEMGAAEARFAGHYRIVVVGCGASCKSVWAVDLVDGSAHNPFTASVGVAYRPDSRLIVENDPAHYEGLLEEMSMEEAAEVMGRYGAPRFWVENDGDFELVGPSDVRFDADSGELIAAE